jgi:hypothetical protein
MQTHILKEKLLFSTKQGNALDLQEQQKPTFKGGKLKQYLMY